MSASSEVVGANEHEAELEVLKWEELGNAVLVPDHVSNLNELKIERHDGRRYQHPSAAVFKEVNASGSLGMDDLTLSPWEREFILPHRSVLYQGTQLISRIDRLVTPGGEDVTAPRTAKLDSEPLTSEMKLPDQELGEKVSKKDQLEDLVQAFNELGGINALKQALAKDINFAILLKQVEKLGALSLVRLVGFTEQKHNDNDSENDGLIVPSVMLETSKPQKVGLEPTDAVVLGLYYRGQDINVDRRELPNES